MNSKLKKNCSESGTVVDMKSTSATETVNRFGSKRDVAAMLQMSVRSVDNYLAAGCPVIKLSERRCRFDLPEVRNWFIKKYSRQYVGKSGSK